MIRQVTAGQKADNVEQSSEGYTTQGKGNHLRVKRLSGAEELDPSVNRPCKRTYANDYVCDQIHTQVSVPPLFDTDKFIFAFLRQAA